MRLFVEVVATFTTYFVQLLAIMNPFSVIPTFLTLMQDLSLSGVKSVLRKATIAGLICSIYTPGHVHSRGF